LSELYLGAQQYSMALISLNLAPNYETAVEDLMIPPMVEEWGQSVERGRVSIESVNHILF
jgi:hypothetical protein